MTDVPSLPFWIEQIGLFLLVASPGLVFLLAYAADGDEAGWLRPWLIALLALAGLATIALGAMLALTSLLPSMLPPDDIGVALPDTRFLLWLGDATMLLGALSLLFAVPAVRRLVARLLPIDPQRLVHLVALDLVLVALWFSAAVALSLPAMMADPEGLEQMGRMTARSGLTGVWMQNLGFVVLSVLGVGWLVARDGRAVAERLGLTRTVPWRWWLGASLAALAMAVATDQLWTWLDPEGAAALGKLSDQLFGPLIAKGGIAAALTIGLAPGIGEELLFRGAAQPRLGLVVTSLLFAAVHTQYTVSPALVQIFVVGLILGTVRIRAGTTAAIAIHATFNAVQVLMSAYG